MGEWWKSLTEFFANEHAVLAVRVGVMALAGLLLTWGVAIGIGRMFERKTGPGQAKVIRRVVLYAGIIVVILSALHQLGVDLSVLLGAAGILTVAIGFASQTSASNIISGLFLLGEQPFVLGDVIQVGPTTGELVSIDLLSVKIRTFDNLMVRVPNELLLKSTVVNLSKYPIRRMDIQFGVSYHEDIERVREVLTMLAHEHPLCLDEPGPVLLPQDFGEFGLRLQFSVWVTRENFLEVRKVLQSSVLAALRREGIEIPYPHRTLSPGEASRPFPIRIVTAEEEQAALREAAEAAQPRRDPAP